MFPCLYQLLRYSLYCHHQRTVCLFHFSFQSKTIILITYLNIGLIKRGCKEARGHKQTGKPDLRICMGNAPRADIFKRKFSTMLSQHTLIKKRPDVTNTASISTGIKFKISQVSCRHSSIKENCEKNIITSLLALVGFKLAASLTSREVINFNCTAFLWCKELPTKPHSVASPSY